MYRLLEKSEISGTCWVEFNITGNRDTYEFWQTSSRYASLDAMQDVSQVFAECVSGFDLYCPTLMDDHMAKDVSMTLEVFASKCTSAAVGNFASELSFFLRESAAEKRFIWVLGV